MTITLHITTKVKIHHIYLDSKALANGGQQKNFEVLKFILQTIKQLEVTKNKIKMETLLQFKLLQLKVKNGKYFFINTSIHRS